MKAADTVDGKLAYVVEEAATLICTAMRIDQVGYAAIGPGRTASNLATLRTDIIHLRRALDRLDGKLDQAFGDEAAKGAVG